MDNLENHEYFMTKALNLAKKGAGFVNPNPMVGAILIKNGKIISQGYHKLYGNNHAEINCINNAKQNIKNSTLYVTLEPCSHYGNTPPCTEAIIKNKISKVIISQKDNNPKICGAEVLIKKDIAVISDILKTKSQYLNRKFNKYITSSLPYVAIKTASSIDGKIATSNGKSKWITNSKSRKLVHKLRNNYTAILTGINTVIKDNPQMTSRLSSKSVNPTRIVLDSNFQTPLYSNFMMLSTKYLPSNQNNLINTNYVRKHYPQVIIAYTKENKQKLNKIEKINKNFLEKFNDIKFPIKTIKCKKNLKNQIDIDDFMFKIQHLNIDSILIEAGGNINQSFIESSFIDMMYSFISNKIIGGKNALTSFEGQGFKSIKASKKLDIIDIKKLDNNILIKSIIGV